ncbi:MAG: hypothetical protein LAP13_08850 [Acidobacteriia bacterium]|nr:hypothetical protein [Terriglobia bacterium]
MKIRRDAVALSSILLTVALLMLAPRAFDLASTTHQSRFRDIATGADASAVGDQIAIPNYYAPLGIASLTIIAIGLVVTWTGYIKGSRWTYFVMFVIVWLWAFPVLMLPLLHAVIPSWRTLEWTRLIKEAISENSVGRAIVVPFVAFLLMVLGLALPVKTFLLGPGSSTRGRANEFS